MKDQSLHSYYNDRAKEYDKVYLIPEEQEDLKIATQLFRELFAGKSVLEIACGTGYWTAQIAPVATAVWATDVNESVLEIAKSRAMPDNVVFEVADMYTLHTDTRYDAVFGGFIWSHILLQDLDGFLARMAGFLQQNGLLVFIDSKQKESGYHNARRIVRTDAQGNTFQTRNLENGTTHIVLKNFPSEAFIRQKLSPYATDIRVVELEHYWIVTARRTA